MIKIDKKEKKESTAVKVAAILLAEKYNGQISAVTNTKGTFLYVKNAQFDVLMTICKTNKKYCMKLEEIIINEKYRGKGIGTSIIKDIQNVAKDNDCSLGLWCEINNDRAFNYYKKLGFAHTETLKDKWMEYN